MKTTKSEENLEKKYKSEGYKCIRKGYPDFVFYKEDSFGEITDVKFVEHKLNMDVLQQEQIIFRKICQKLGLDYCLIREKQEQGELTTTLVVSRELRDWLGEKGNKNETFDDIIRRLSKMEV